MSAPSRREALYAIAALALSGCGGNSGPPPAAKREITAQWQDVFDGTPEIFAIIRPQAIKRDQVYGPLFKSALRMAQARSEMRGATTLEALEGCEQIIVGVRKDPNSQADDAVLVLRGVPASLDAAEMKDASGQQVFRLVDPRAKVPELEWVDRRSDGNGAVFVLPDRTWVGTIGDARLRARQAFASPFGRPIPKADPQALAVVRFDAATLLSGPRYAKSALLGPLTKKLTAVTLALLPGKDGVLATLQYSDEDASAWAEMHVKRIVEQLGGARPNLAWLKDAKVGRGTGAESNAVTVKVAIPPRLLEDLPKATGSDLL